LLPVFALGRAQELLLILDEFWEAHPDLQDVPIYYASALAKRCMSIYQTYLNMMNDNVRKRSDIENPFDFKYVSNLKSADTFNDNGPCVVMASPGMLQSGLSRQLFERWCTDKRNGVILLGYAVDGTLAKHIMTEPSTINRLDGKEVPLRCSIDYITFSAHSDFLQTSEFIDAASPSKIVLVHGEANEMGRLRMELDKKYNKDAQAHPDPSGQTPIEIFTPKNCQTVRLEFRGAAVGKAIGVLPKRKPEDGAPVSGVMVRQDFNHILVHPANLHKYSNIKIAKVGHRLVVPTEKSIEAVEKELREVFGSVKRVGAWAGVSAEEAAAAAAKAEEAAMKDEADAVPKGEAEPAPKVEAEGAMKEEDEPATALKEELDVDDLANAEAGDASMGGAKPEADVDAGDAGASDAKPKVDAEASVAKAEAEAMTVEDANPSDVVKAEPEPALSSLPTDAPPTDDAQPNASSTTLALKPAASAPSAPPVPDALVVGSAVTITPSHDSSHVVLTWSADHTRDMLADSIAAICLRPPAPAAESDDSPVVLDPPGAVLGEGHYALAIAAARRMLGARFGAVMETEERPGCSTVVVDLVEAEVEWASGQVRCEDEGVRERVRLAVRRIHAAVFPIPDLYCECCACGDMGQR